MIQNVIIIKRIKFVISQIRSENGPPNNYKRIPTTPIILPAQFFHPDRGADLG